MNNKKDVNKITSRIIRDLKRRAKTHSTKMYNTRETHKVIKKHVDKILSDERAKYIPKRVSVLIDRGDRPECACCGSERNLTFDHIIPTSKGGADDNENGQILCLRCNGAKGNKLIDNIALLRIIKNESRK